MDQYTSSIPYFDSIYKENLWKHGSGEGSLPKNTADYRAILQNLLEEHRVKTVVDVGCGDWQIASLINWRGIDYIGYDVVKDVVQANNALYSSEHISFRHYNGDFTKLPQADMYICKDVLQHVSDAAIFDFIGCLGKCRVALITNCVNPYGPTVNKDILGGQFRYLDLLKPPYSLKATLVKEFSYRREAQNKIATKHVLLYVNG